MRLIILSPEKTVLDRKVSAVELPGAKGRFVVLENHAPLLSSLEKGFIGYDIEGEDKRITIDIKGGFAAIKNNTITVCVE